MTPITKAFFKQLRENDIASHYNSHEIILMIETFLNRPEDEKEKYVAPIYR